MAFNGRTDNFSTIQILNLIRLALRTGKLAFTGTYPVELFFSEGQLIYAAKRHETPDLLDTLVSAGKLIEAQIGQIREQIAQVEDLWLSQWLLETGYVTKADLIQSIRRQVLHIVYETILQADGEFTFEDGALPSLDVPVTAIDLRDVINQGSCLLQEWDELQTAVPHLDMTLRATDQLTPAAGRMLMSKTEWFVGTACQAHHTIRHIAQTLDLDDFQMRHIVHNLLKMGMVEIVEAKTVAKQDTLLMKPTPPSKFEAALQNIRSGLQRQLVHSW